MTSVLSLLPHGSPQASFTVAMPRGDGLLIPLQDSLSVPDPSRPAALALDTAQCHRVLLLADVFPAVHCSGSDCFAASSHQPGVSPEELLSLAWASAVSRSDPGLKRGLRQFGLLHEPWLTFAVQKGKRKIVRPSWPEHQGMGTTTFNDVLSSCKQGANHDCAGAQKMSPSQRKTFPETASLKLLQVLPSVSRHCFLHS